MFHIGCIGFGGGNALIPIIQNYIVEKQGMICQEEYDEDVLIASVTPGALPVEIAGGIGSRIAGWKGMIAVAFGMTLPGYFLTILMLSAFTLTNDFFMKQIQFITIGISAFICLLLTDYIKDTFQDRNPLAGIENKAKLFVLITVFALTGGKNWYKILGISATPRVSLAAIHIFALAFFIIILNSKNASMRKNVFAVLCCVIYVMCEEQIWIADNRFLYISVRLLMILAAFHEVIRQIKEQKRCKRETTDKHIPEFIALALAVGAFLLPATIITDEALGFAGKGTLSSLMSFGGGDAYLTVADGLFVESGMVTDNFFYGSLVPVVNVLPGSILCKSLSGVGFYIGNEIVGQFLVGILFSVLGLVCSIAASCGVFTLCKVLYENFNRLDAFIEIKKWIRPIIAGLMLQVMSSLIWQSRKMDMSTEGWFYVICMLSIYLLDVYLKSARKWSNISLIGISVAVSLVACNI